MSNRTKITLLLAIFLFNSFSITHFVILSRTRWRVPALPSDVEGIDFASSFDEQKKQPSTLSSLPARPTGPLSPKLILFVDFPSYYELKNVEGPTGLAHCNAETPQKQPMKCEITQDIRLFKEADAVVFNTHQKRRVSQMAFRPIKRRGTTWTFFAVESPAFSNNKLFDRPEFRHKFNSTWTYRSDSEFKHVYVRSQLRKSPLSQEAREMEEKKRRHTFRSKSKMSAIFVSHCKAPSHRDEYIAELRKHTEVDVYGHCGRLKCKERFPCNLMVSFDYKFYLAFENSICQDYVTEKVLNAMQSGRIIPVVRGGANYSRIFPRNSVIDTSQFSSPKELAHYLNALADDEDGWIRFFEWTWQYEIVAPLLSICEYCHHLYKPSTRLYDNVYEWWAKDACQDPKDF
ncbi:alpha-(1,3)-fucosyltransferase [Plakobranchus ocellatus]|uniref:Fucosyltransferase n=1 Tax=Plakobranchus ocellatus TaxID=259542 RepID=A0AAV4B5U7_9GAST|nr:alpha-(1,3)-fucosyltransferase [Plakobranchus ocellatus]